MVSVRTDHDVPTTASGVLEQARRFEAIVKRFRKPLLQYFRKRGINATDAEDLTQIVFLRLLRKVRQDPDELADGYIFVTASSVLTDHYRGRVAHRVGETEEIDPELPDPGVTAEKILEDRQILNVIIDVISKMKPKQRRAFELHRFESLSYGQIAVRMGASVSSIEKYVMAALAELRKAAESCKND